MRRNKGGKKSVSALHKTKGPACRFVFMQICINCIVQFFEAQHKNSLKHQQKIREQSVRSMRNKSELLIEIYLCCGRHLCFYLCFTSAAAKLHPAHEKRCRKKEEESSE